MPIVYVPAQEAPPAARERTARDGTAARGLFAEDDYARQRASFADAVRFPATPLRELPALAAALGLERLLVKDETRRFGLPAFKALGAMFAVDGLRRAHALAPGATLVCASEGNHGRAVAHAAALAGLACRVYLADGVAESRANAIRTENATIVRVRGTYDDAVRAAAAEAAAHGWRVISDTSGDGSEAIPREIMLGYTRLMDEAAMQWGDRAPDVVFVQGGVGGLAGAIASWLAWHLPSDRRPRLVIVEPASAACIQTSARAGHPIAIAGPLTTIMGGLRCGEMSPIALPAIEAVADAYVAIEDDWARDAVRRLAHPSPPDPVMAVGPSGAAGLAGLLACRDGDSTTSLTRALGLTPEATTALIIATEGVTEPDLWHQVAGM